MSDEIHLNDIGTEFRILIKDGDDVVDLSTATIVNIIFRKPSGEINTVVADFYTDGTDGIIKYNAVLGDLDQAGVYKIQAYVEVGSGNYSTNIGQFRVHCNLD